MNIIMYMGVRRVSLIGAKPTYVSAYALQDQYVQGFGGTRAYRCRPKFGDARESSGFSEYCGLNVGGCVLFLVVYIAEQNSSLNRDAEVLISHHAQTTSLTTEPTGRKTEVNRETNKLAKSPWHLYWHRQKSGFLVILSNPGL